MQQQQQLYVQRRRRSTTDTQDSLVLYAHTRTPAQFRWIGRCMRGERTYLSRSTWTLATAAAMMTIIIARRRIHRHCATTAAAALLLLYPNKHVSIDTHTHNILNGRERKRAHVLRIPRPSEWTKKMRRHLKPCTVCVCVCAQQVERLTYKTYTLSSMRAHALTNRYVLRPSPPSSLSGGRKGFLCALRTRFV